MNYLHHPNLLVHYWSAVHTEFDKILDKFVREPGWLFQDLGVVAKKANIGAIYRSVCTTQHSSSQGMEERLDHFLRVISVILDAAKIQWLAPWRNCVVDTSKGEIPPFLKRQTGGFFLLYMLYLSQPLPNRYRQRQRIIMDAQDIISMHVYTQTMLLLPKTSDHFKELGRQLVEIYNDMINSAAFEFSVVSDTMVTPCHSIRTLLANKMCDFTKIIYSLKDVRDQLQYITHHESVKVFKSLVGLGKYLPQHELPKRTPEKKQKLRASKRKENVEKKKTWTVAEIKALEEENDIGKLANDVVCALKSLDFGPVLNRKTVLGMDEGLLDKEMGNIKKRYQSWRDTNDKCSKQQREIRLSQKDRSKTASTILRSYYNSDFEWVGEMFGNKDCPPQTDDISVERIAGLESEKMETDDDIMEEIVGISEPKMTEEFSEEDGEDEDDDWVTDNDSDLDQEPEENVSTKRMKNSALAKDTSTSATPTRRSKRVISMPAVT